MNLGQIACLTTLIVGLSTVASDSLHAQYLGSRSLNGFAGGKLGGFGNGHLSGVARGNFAGRGFRGTANIIPPPSFHEFARTIPRPFGNSILPFYALYPPVYYSYVVPRPYGFSPFALPAGKGPVEALASGPATPAEIINPHYRPEEGAEEVAPPAQTSVKSASVIINQHVKQPRSVKQRDLQDKTAQATKMIFNPFVDQPKIAGQQSAVQR